MGSLHDADRANMMHAIELARASDVGGWRIGAVLARSNGTVISTGYRGESGVSVHAEALAIRKAQELGEDISGATAYVTLEPCANLESKAKEDCSTTLVNAGVRRVFIGGYDTNPRIYRLGWRNLRDAGVELRDFPPDLRRQVQELGSERQGDFLERRGRVKGRAKFDYTLNGGRYAISLQVDGRGPKWITQWGQKGQGSIYAYQESGGSVAEARFARSFAEIDDPDVFDFHSHYAAIQVGGIAVFKNQHGHLLAKVLEVHAGPEWGTSHVSLKFEYEIRISR
ncbi:deaminase [Streptomyces sp. CB03578]|uniref:deaminase n=1 Tax=Streptomyces sp. CB03578 TaxID=1718987 RepID=UPI00093B17F6|nr:deaminase [Streptomyces sp. CB03578]